MADMSPAPPAAGYTYEVSEFACLRCGNCCKGDGVVILEDDEVPAIAATLGLDPREFLRLHTRQTPWGERVLNDKFIGGEQWCVFLERGADGLYACAINGAKPAQCRDFPLKWRAPDAHRWCAGLISQPGATER